MFSIYLIKIGKLQTASFEELITDFQYRKG